MAKVCTGFGRECGAQFRSPRGPLCKWCRRDAERSITALVGWLYRAGMTDAEADAFDAWCRVWRETCLAASRLARREADRWRGPPVRRPWSDANGNLVVGGTWAELAALTLCWNLESMAEQPPRFPPLGYAVVEPAPSPGPGGGE
jgi:hypothetical protein